MAPQSKTTDRVFRTSWFSKEAKKAHIFDEELCAAIQQVMLGQADDLGGGVFKKRLNKNMHRSIIVAKAGQFWVYEYLFAKKDQANIAIDELAYFRKLARRYEALTEQQVDELIEKNRWTEICHGSQA
jgi:hypothetical protein